jgi:RNA polymerase sigma-70 factor, ECF subfamily
VSVDSRVPETRHSLLLRVRHRDDRVAWSEFIELYGPVIYRAVRYRGLQDADAQDVTQQVLMSVANALEQRPHDPNRARFRTWLSRVTRNAALNAIRKLRLERASGDESIHRQLSQMVDVASQDALLLDQEYERELFRIAAERIKAEFELETWRAFWMTMVDGQSIDSVAKQLGKRIGSIYAARSRVIRRLRVEIESLSHS